jgi:hypothetical protein
MDLRINEPAFGKIALRLADISPLCSSVDAPLQFQQHPNVKKFTASSGDKIISLKDSSRNFPVGQGLGVLRWKFVTKNESLKPLNGSWGQLRGDEKCTLRTFEPLCSNLLAFRKLGWHHECQHRIRSIGF